MTDTDPAAQPVLETARLRLTPRTLADTDDCLRMDRDPDVTRFIVGPWSDPVAHRAFVEARTLAAYPAGQGYWMLRPRSDPGRFLGWVLLIPVDGVGPEIEIGWRLRRDAWGAGFAPEAARAVIDHAFGTLGLAEVIAEIDPGNHNSIRVAEKIGLIRRQSRPEAGQVYLRHSLTRAEHQAASGA